MKGDMLSVYPQLGNPAIDYAWAGLMGYALHKMPLIGQIARGVVCDGLRRTRPQHDSHGRTIDRARHRRGR